MEPKIMIILGSASDFNVAEKSINILEILGISYDVRVASAHRTHEKVKKIVEESAANGVEVFIGIAGLSAHLPGIIAANTHKPVVGVPVSVKLGGIDALFATVQMPVGAPVATVGIDRGENGAILAAQIIGIYDVHVRTKLSKMRKEFFFKINKDEEVIAKKLTGKHYSRHSFEIDELEGSNEYNLDDYDDPNYPDVAVISGSYSDIHVAQKTTRLLDKIGIIYDTAVISPIRQPKNFESYMEATKSVKLYIAISGLSAHVTGAVVAFTEKPVIGVPCGKKLDGIDALLSMVNMPPGVPVATTGIDSGANAALIALEMLSLGDFNIKHELLQFKGNMVC
ncbi:MAG: 5-(carboxyamino)imidazole ribonucleotide mutase [Methanobacterium sp.]|nr:5-(carboxyamino)imidazole ribonucleotide mutase [Methanobacterium sp.]